MVRGISETVADEPLPTVDVDGGDLPSRGPQLESISISDDPRAWAVAGFGVEQDPVVHIGNTTLRFSAGDGGFRGWGFDGLSPRDVPELPTGITLMDPRSAGPFAGGTSPAVGTKQPNGIVSIDHIVLQTNDCLTVTAQLRESGFHPRRTRRTSIGDMPALQTFFWAGDVIIELVGPPDPPKPEPERATSATATFFGLALVSADLTQTSNYLGDLLGTPRPAVQEGRQVATLRGRDVGISVPVLIMSPHV